MALLLRIMCWNIAEGSLTGAVPPNTHIPAIAQQIRSKSPDIVLLNEVKHWDLRVGGWLGDYVRQTQRLAELVDLPYYQSGNTERTGWTGHKAVAILSRYPLGQSQLHPVMHNNRKTQYATLQTSISIDNRTHHLFSTRFTAHSNAENVSAHRQALQLVQRLDPNEPVIFGGDFNVNRVEHTHFVDFVQKSGLTNAFYEYPDPTPCAEDPEKLKDYVLYRGPYKGVHTELRCPWGGQAPELELSEHPWLFVELVSPPTAETVLVPNVRKTPQEQAAQVVRAAGLEPKFTGSAGPGAWVSDQSPVAGTRVIVGSVVMLELRVGPTEVLVPDVREMSPTQAAQIIQAAGLEPKFTGSGTWVRTQRPQAGTRISAGSTVTLELRAGPIP
jgi:endonuclease/exonuclease/phosphatase family metal-dependent hydrolase